MDNKQYAHKVSVINAFLILVFIYFAVTVPIAFLRTESFLLQAVHVFDVLVCLWAVYYLKTTRRIELPSLALCFFACTTVIAVVLSGGFFGSGPFLVLPYVPFVTFLSGNRRAAYIWLVLPFVAMCVALGLQLLDRATLPYAPETFALFTFMYLLTILLLSAYTKDKERADMEVARKTSELNRKNKKLRQLNESKDNFILLASHQLRTPATVVKQYLGMLLDGYGGKLAGEQLGLAKTGYVNNERQIKIINDLLLVAQADNNKIKLHTSPTNIKNLTQEVIKEYRPIFKNRNQRVSQIYPNRLPLIETDSERLRMAVENIVDNASKYTPKGKRITVEVKSFKNYLAIRITDEGVGINQKDRSKLFKKFSRINNPLSAEVSGSGLGLYWAKKVIDFHRGKIVVRSLVGKGSTFEIQLPR